MPHAPQDLRTFFITTVTANRRRLFQLESNAALLINVLSENRQKDRFLLHAFVLMPDHIHLILTPDPEISLEKAIQYIKGGFSFRLKSKLDVWERSFAEHRIKDAQDYCHHTAYLEQNPVRARLSAFPSAYPFSSASHLTSVDPPPSHLRAHPIS